MKKSEADSSPRSFNSANALTVGEVADYLRVHRSTVYRLLRAHQIRGFKVGGLWRFSPADLNRLWTALPSEKRLPPTKDPSKGGR